MAKTGDPERRFPWPTGTMVDGGCVEAATAHITKSDRDRLEEIAETRSASMDDPYGNVIPGTAIRVFALPHGFMVRIFSEPTPDVIKAFTEQGLSPAFADLYRFAYAQAARVLDIDSDATTYPEVLPLFTW